MLDFLKQAFDGFLHIDQHLETFIRTYGLWTYGMLFVVIFFETGIVVTPFLPGDSLLFAAGALAGRELVNPWLIFVLLAVAAILGDSANYWIGKVFGKALIRRSNGRWIKQKHLDRTHAFFEKYGGKTIVIARFVPIIRTMAPFVAGLGAMTYGKFILYNVVGGILWVAICVGAGYFFGGLALVKDNFSLVILAIIFISIVPGIVEFLKAYRESRRSGQPE